MLMEGTGKYFLMLFLVFLIVYITAKICVGFLFKRAKVPFWKAYIPFYTPYVIVELLNLKKSLFYFTLIPFANLYFYYIIIQNFIVNYNQNEKDTIWYLLFPMYHFPKLVFKRPKFIYNEYEMTADFVETQNVLSKEFTDKLPEKLDVVEVVTYDDGGTVDTYVEDSIEETEDIKNFYTENSVFEDEDKPEFESSILERKLKGQTMASENKQKLCPKCGAKLTPSAATCFFCGTTLM